MIKPIVFASCVVLLAGCSSHVADTAPDSLTVQEGASGFCSVDGIVETEHKGFTGAGYINTTNNINMSAVWSVTAKADQEYAVKVRFADGGSANRPGDYLVNGTKVGTLDVSPTGSWATYKDSAVTKLHLHKGKNTITLKATTDNGLPNIDYIQFVGKGLTATNCAK